MNYHEHKWKITESMIKDTLSGGFGAAIMHGIMLRAIFYGNIKTLLEKTAAALHRRGVHPAHLTLGGLFINALGCLLYAYGHFLTGSLIILAAGAFDMLDGALARFSGKATKYGAFMDSVVDRYSDFFIFGGLAIYFARTGHPGMVSLVLVVICGALLTSYTKARAESLIPKCDAGWIERPERIILICAGGIFQFLIPALWILAFGTHLTALQRIYYTWKETVGKEIDVSAAEPPATSTPARPEENYRLPREI